MNPEATKDRAIGALLGLAVGDAVGTTLEFTDRDTYHPCAYFSGLLVDAIQGMPKEDLLRPRLIEGADEVVHVASGSWKGKSRNDIQSSGYVIHTLEAALWVVENASDFKAAILLAANLGGDADTVAAVTGQLAGSIWGAEDIPQSWKTRLAWRDHIENLGGQLFDRHLYTSQA